MRNISLVVIFVVTIISMSGCQTGASPGQSSTSGSNITSADARPCIANYVVTGNLLTGKQFKTHVPLPGMSPDNAYKKAYASIVQRGWQIIQADKEVRIISANQQVSYSEGGKTVPLNILIKDGPSGGSTIAFTFSLAGGIYASEDSVRDGFCEFAKDVGDSPNTIDSSSRQSPQNKNRTAQDASEAAREARLPDPTSPVDRSAQSAIPVLTKKMIIDAQTRLTSLGFDTGGVDGNFGPRSRAALRKFQASRGLPTSGELTPETLKALEVVRNP